MIHKILLYEAARFRDIDNDFKKMLCQEGRKNDILVFVFIRWIECNLNINNWKIGKGIIEKHI